MFPKLIVSAKQTNVMFQLSLNERLGVARTNSEVHSMEKLNRNLI